MCSTLTLIMQFLFLWGNGFINSACIAGGQGRGHFPPLDFENQLFLLSFAPPPESLRIDQVGGNWHICPPLVLTLRQALIKDTKNDHNLSFITFENTMLQIVFLATIAYVYIIFTLLASVTYSHVSISHTFFFTMAWTEVATCSRYIVLLSPIVFILLIPVSVHNMEGKK